MPAIVILKAVRGSLAGTQYVFEDRSSSVLGREVGCIPQIANIPSNMDISRHHCLLDINPPDIRVRDFGSRNGTFVNGKRIGQRGTDQTPEEGQKTEFPEFDLSDGDELQVSTAVFQVEIVTPELCERCFEEIPDGKPESDSSEEVLCKRCVNETHGLWKNLPSSKQTCSQCGANVADELSEGRVGNYICVSCRDNPHDLVKRLITRKRSQEGDQLGVEGYEIIREIGHGGMGVVYLARNQESGDSVALKVMLPKVAATPSATRQFLREIQNTQALMHRNIVSLMEFGNSQGSFFCTLEYCRSGDVLSEMERRNETYSVDEATGIILKVLDGLEYAHNARIPNVRMKDGSYQTGTGLVHRDLKPNNIFLSDSEVGKVVKIGDFGLSKAFDLAGFSGQTRTGAFAGTPVFMPRQQVINFKYCDPEVDVWAAAASLCFMLTGQPVRDINPRKDPWLQVLQISPTRIGFRGNTVPRRLAAVIDKALEEEPEISFKSAQKLRDALAGAL